VNETFFVNALTSHAACYRGTMLKTVDGGENWYHVKWSKAHSFSTVYFINENIGFASQINPDSILKTIDGGETWSRVPGISQTAYNFHFLDEKIGFFSGKDGATFKTTDGGDSWKSIKDKIKSILDTSTLFAIHFFDENIGLVTGGYGRISKTTDSGKTWTGNSLTYNDFRKLQFLDNKTAYTCTKDSFYKSTNAGNTWSLIGPLNLKPDASIGSFHFVNENIGYATSSYPAGGDEAYKTVDGGLTWEIFTNEDIIDMVRINTRRL